MSNNPSSRPQARRNPSSAWTRLRTPQTDPLDLYTLPSKGETRLLDPKTQESYFEKIVSRYMKFCASAGSGENLETAFAALNIRDTSSKTPAEAGGGTETGRAETDKREQQTAELHTLLMAMRKLREALVAIRRTDAFSQRVYIFIIHAAILCGHLESYHPALRYLLQRIHPQTPLSQPEAQEFVGYLVLDLACRQGEFTEAFRVKKAYGLRDRRVEATLRALVRDDWVSFWRIRRAVDGYQRVLMGWAEEGMRLHALKCLGRAYMFADRGFVERSADRNWDCLVKADKVGWVLEEGGRVVIRKPKLK